MMEALIVTASGTHRTVTPANGTHFSLQEMYKLLKCELVEIIRLSKNMIMVVDEEGKLKSEPDVNVNASLIAMMHGAIFLGDCVCGDVMICDTSMVR